MPAELETADPLLTHVPDTQVSIRDLFGVDSDMMVPAFTTRDSHVPDIDDAYRFDPQTTLAICAVRRTAFRYCAAGEASLTSAS